jgi:hypothetical protein
MKVDVSSSPAHPHPHSHLPTTHPHPHLHPPTPTPIIQLSLYNPNTQLFTSVTLLVEFLLTGGLYPSARFDPFILSGIFPPILFGSLMRMMCFAFRFYLDLSISLSYSSYDDDCLFHGQRTAIVFCIEIQLFQRFLVLDRGRNYH